MEKSLKENEEKRRKIEALKANKEVLIKSKEIVKK